jgi:MFS transporter, MFS domain-containing protein family, molybdate-anion transporter
VYALYKHYGFNQSEIGALFIYGFGASLFFGTIAGSMADKYGRKLMCICFGVMYALSCATKHSSSYQTLMVGRILGGICTSLLFSVFESWMVHEHKRRGFPEAWLSETFASATSGNGIVAIVSGVAAGIAVDRFGPVAPFDMSMICLIIGTLIVQVTWGENFGNSEINMRETMSAAWETVKADKHVRMLGIVQSAFEGAMFVFVFMWTPALESTTDEPILHGWIFASMMVCVLIGSTLFDLLSNVYKVPVVNFAPYIMALGGVSLATAAMIPNCSIRLFCFFAFELAVGMFWPAICTLRGEFVPAHVRSTVMNFFRIPLNMIVIAVLYNIGSLPQTYVFGFCVVCLTYATYTQWKFKQTHRNGAGYVVQVNDDTK